MEAFMPTYRRAGMEVWTTERTEYTKEYDEGRVIQHNSIGSREIEEVKHCGP
jgi:hypothetical protein